MIRPHVSRPFTAIRKSRITNEEMKTNIFSPSCIITFISDERTDEIRTFANVVCPLCVHRVVRDVDVRDEGYKLRVPIV